jgi:hypothetical protein
MSDLRKTSGRTNLELSLTEHIEIVGDWKDDDSVHIPCSALALNDEVKANATLESFLALFN